MLKLFAYPQTRATRVVWMLEEIGTDYDYVVVDLRQGEGRKPPYSDLNPAGKVPTIVDDELVLSESAAICSYLGEKYPASQLLPEAATPQRATYYQWCFFVLSELEQPLWTIAKHRFALPEKWRVTAVIDTAVWEFAKAAKVLHQHMNGREFVVGDRFSAADILVAHTLMWAKAYELNLDHDSLQQYLARMKARPALAQARAREQHALEAGSEG